MINPWTTKYRLNFNKINFENHLNPIVSIQSSIWIISRTFFATKQTYTSKVLSTFGQTKNWLVSGRLASASNKTEMSNKIGVYILILNFQVDLKCFFTQKTRKLKRITHYSNHGVFSKHSGNCIVALIFCLLS